MTDAISVVVPAYDEAAGIVDTVRELLAHGDARGLSLEVIVSDDGSRDGSADLVERAFAGDRRVRVIRNPHRGKGAAVRAGVAAARHPLLLLTDADLAVPLADLDKLLAAIATHAVAIGSKWTPGRRADYPLLRRLGSTLGQWLIAALVVRGFHDTQCGFKLFRRDAAQSLFALSRLDGFGYDFEVLLLTRRAGLPIAEIPVAVRHRAGGSVRLHSYLRTLGEIAALWRHRLLGRYPRDVMGRPPVM